MNGEDDRWSLYSAAQHLPAVLTDPNRGKQSNFFTKTWGDSFVEKTEIEKSPFLPEITYAHFETYLRKYGKRHKRHLRLSQTNFEEGDSKSKKEVQFSTKDIPEIFLSADFRLNDSNVFKEVFEQRVEGRLKSEHELQEELSYYLDIVEEQIAQQVSQKSGAFFHAMTSHDTIMEQMGVATNEVRLLRRKIQQIDKAMAKDSLKLIGLARSKANHAKLVNKLKLMSTVLQTQPNLQVLLSASDYVAALELISGTQDILAKELAGVTSLRYLPSQLKEMLKFINKMLSNEFERYAATDLNRPLSSPSGVLEPERLISLIAGLLRQNHFQFLEIYKQEAVTAAQALLKQIMIEHLAEDENETCLTGSGEVTPSIDAKNWLQLLNIASQALGKLMQRVKDVHDIVKETSTNLSVDNEQFLSLEEQNRLELKLKDLLTSVCDYCNERLAALVSTQSDKQAVTAHQISELSTIVEMFSNLCIDISGKNCPALKAAFKIQAGNYVNRFHAQRKDKLTLLLDAERWKAAEVPPKIQLIVDKLAEGKVFKSLPGSPTEEEMTNKYVNKSAATLKVGNQDYVTVGTVLILISLVCEYCVCAYDLPSLAPKIGRNLSELLRTFNSRTCQLVLGAGALKTAGLNTITSTNLALASRALQLVLWMIPNVRAHFRTITSDVLNGFDVVEEDIGHHIQQLETKVITIMNTLLGEQLAEWNAKPPVPSKQFRNISRHLTKLHEAVSSALPEEQVKDIYEIIHQNFKARLRDQLSKMNIANNGGPQHGVVTTELIFYIETMKTLKALPEKHLSDKAIDRKSVV